MLHLFDKAAWLALFIVALVQVHSVACSQVHGTSSSALKAGARTQITLSTEALFGPSESVPFPAMFVDELASASFNSSIGKAPQQFWLVEFMAPWCPHCRHFISDMERLGTVYVIGCAALAVVWCVADISCNSTTRRAHLQREFAVSSSYWQSGLCRRQQAL